MKLINKINIKDFYSTQSVITEPGDHAALFKNLPIEVSELCRTIQGWVMHIADESLFEYKIPSKDYAEIDSRYARVIIQKILEKNPGNLTQTRNIQDRIVGVCRDMALLACSILRSRGIPARLRVGFFDYLIPGIYLDEIFLEYWSESKEKWCIADVRMSPELIEKYKLNIDFDLYDIPPEKFIFAEQAWNLCREGKINPRHIGSRKLRGLWYVRNSLIQSLAMFNKKEILFWDAWGPMLPMLTLKNGKPDLPESQLKMLDELSDFLLKNSHELSAIQTYYREHPDLQVPNQILVCNPFLKPELIEVFM